MSRIVWDPPLYKKYEIGVSKGVLYLDREPGVPWNGLISIQESYTGGEAEPRYQDGVKAYNYAPTQEYEADISAYTYPDEFEECIGIHEAHKGLYVSEQERTPFGLSYQTNFSDPNAKDGMGYKIHLIYNAVATPNDIDRNTIYDEVEPLEFTWHIETTPVKVPGYRPTSHFIIDSSEVEEDLFNELCRNLYGDEKTNPTLLLPKDILEIAGDWDVLYPSPEVLIPSPTLFPSEDTIPGRL